MEGLIGYASSQANGLLSRNTYLNNLQTVSLDNDRVIKVADFNKDYTGFIILGVSNTEHTPIFLAVSCRNRTEKIEIRGQKPEHLKLYCKNNSIFVICTTGGDVLLNFIGESGTLVPFFTTTVPEGASELILS